LVSINSFDENTFVLNLCGISTDCWVGLEEKEGTGNADTPQLEQRWVWADGSVPGTGGEGKQFKDWNLWGTKYGEPNNGKLKETDKGEDERYGMVSGGHWFDKPASHQAQAVCEMSGQGVLTTVTSTTTSFVPTTTTTTTTPALLCYTGWSARAGKCYRVSTEKLDYSTAGTWCRAQGSVLVSINDGAENEFVRELCSAGKPCWLGIEEEPFDGDKNTPQSEQKWVWSDRSTPRSNNYTSWHVPQYGGIHYGQRHREPNNGRTKAGVDGVDERRAIIDRGEWYDKPLDFQAHAACETDGVLELTTTSTTTTLKRRCEAVCAKDADLHGWRAVCQTQSARCNGCKNCDAKQHACPNGWISHHGKCYKVNVVEKSSYFQAKSWCTQQNAQLVTISSADKNDFIWRICGDGTDDPISNPMDLTRQSCWLGLSEKAGSGNEFTPAAEQMWVWPDGSTPSAWQYENWKKYEGGHNEPNNGKSPVDKVPFDERYVVMNQIIGGMSGKWYDKPANYEAHAVCELDPAVAAAQNPLAFLDGGRIGSWAASVMQHLHLVNRDDSAPEEGVRDAVDGALEDGESEGSALSLLQQGSSLRMRGSYAARQQISLFR